MPKQTSLTRITRKDVVSDVFAKPSVSVVPSLTTAGALGGAIFGMFSWPVAAGVFAFGLAWFFAMSVKYLGSEEEVRKLIAERRVRENARLEAGENKKREKIIKECDPATRPLLEDVVKIFKEFSKEAADSDPWLIEMIDEVQKNVFELRDRAFSLADFKKKLVQQLRSTDERALKREVKRLERRIGDNENSPLISALKSTQNEIGAVEQLRDHNDEIYAQINNIKSAMRQANIDLIKLKTEAKLAETGNADIEAKTKELRRKLEVVSTASKKVMQLELQ